eukprot:4520511-Pyramimonas_sp.AAC.1
MPGHWSKAQKRKARAIQRTAKCRGALTHRALGSPPDTWGAPPEERGRTLIQRGWPIHYATKARWEQAAPVIAS